MNKKTYIVPEAETLNMQMLSMLCGTIVDEGDNNKDDEYITDPGQLGAKDFSGNLWDRDE